MKFAYKFNNLLGTVYRKGNLLFTPDGNSVISPVGNRISIYDLKNNKAKTLSLESSHNYTAFDLSPNGCLLIAANEDGKVQMISVTSCTVIDTHKFFSEIRAIKFSPDGKLFAIAQDNCVNVFFSPGELTGQFNSFLQHRKLIASISVVTSLDWSYDSKLLAIGTDENTTKIFGIAHATNVNNYILAGHTDPIVGCFFDAATLNVNTVSRNGQLCLWECGLTSEELKWEAPSLNDEPTAKKQRVVVDESSSSESEDDIDPERPVEEDETSRKKTNESISLIVDGGETDRDEQGKLIGKVSVSNPFRYKKIARHYLCDEPRKENPNAELTSVAYHKKTRLLVVAFSTGAFYLYEMPEVNMIHSLSISEHSIDATCFNDAGDWIAIASSQLGQMLVWEWQSEQYIMKQQGHSSEMTCISYSSDGQYIASGGEDAKVKMWNVTTGFCFVTFSEHTSCVSAIQFSNNNKFVVSASYDGTVRAYDIIRYRNFRTLTTPEPVQFASVAVDVSGELVAAGGQDVFEIFLWSLKLGRLLEVISGHEGPVSSIAFSPIATSSTLVSASWDKTIKIWNCLESSSEHETIDVLTDALAVAFKPDGEEVAVSTLNGNISVFSVRTSQQLALIEGRNDLGSGRSEIDLTTAKTNLEGKAFLSLVYSADGECILAAGKSKNVCIYHVKERLLLKKFEITQNESFDAINDFISHRKMTEFGNLAMIEERDALEGGRIKIRLPGVMKGDMASRNFKPEVNVFAIRFSPTGQSWAAATTEGLLIYSLDRGLIFDPFHLSMEITPKSTREKLAAHEYSGALIMALKLNEPVLVHQIIEGIPVGEVDLVGAELPDAFALRTLQFVTKIINTSPHIEFYLKWLNILVTRLGQTENLLQQHTLVNLQQSLSRKYELLSRVCDFNKYTLKVLKQVAEGEAKKETSNGDGMHIVDDDDDGLLLVKRVSDDENDVEMDSDDTAATDSD